MGRAEEARPYINAAGWTTSGSFFSGASHPADLLQHLNVRRILEPAGTLGGNEMLNRRGGNIHAVQPEYAGLRACFREPHGPGEGKDVHARIIAFFTDIGDRAEYEHDFGDGWEHDVVLEQVSSRVAKAKYPQCLAGERACPPEDCGGPHGYHELLTHAFDRADPDAEEWREQLGPDFDPESFEPRSVKFDNPKRRWKRAFGED